MDETQERAIIEDALKTVKDATGQTIKGYLAPALTHTIRTMDLLAEYGIQYTCDLFQDDQPQPIKTATGRMISMPYSLEINDHYAYNVFGQTARQYTDVLKRQFDALLSEGEESGTVMCIPLHAYLVGRSQRIDPLGEALDYITRHEDDIWVTTAAEIAEYYLKHYYDAALINIAHHNGVNNVS